MKKLEPAIKETAQDHPPTSKKAHPCLDVDPSIGEAQLHQPLRTAFMAPLQRPLALIPGLASKGQLIICRFMGSNALIHFFHNLGVIISLSECIPRSTVLRYEGTGMVLAQLCSLTHHVNTSHLRQ